MAVNLTNADSALKTVYLDVISDQLNNNVNPFFAAIKHSTNDVWGKEVRKLAIHGVNGGIGAGTEDGALPSATGNKYSNFVSTLKNIYGVIEISDKAVRASENNVGAFVSLLNAEMEGLIKSGTFNFGRMLFGDGTGKLGIATTSSGRTLDMTSVKNIEEGMLVDLREDVTGTLLHSGVGIVAVDREKLTVTIDRDISVEPGTFLTIQGSYQNEITGLEAIFNLNSESLYGLNREENKWLNPYTKAISGNISEIEIQKAIDIIEEKSGNSVNLIVCSWGVRRALQQLFAENKRNIDTVELAGGYKAMSYNGIPIVADRFCPSGTMYLLNTEDFTLHQLCDWQWLEGEEGKVLKQIPGKPVYTATLVKYAELICAKPYGQGKIYSITEA